jgi:hypothetical protein
MRKQCETDPVSFHFASKRKNFLCETGAPYLQGSDVCYIARFSCITSPVTTWIYRMTPKNIPRNLVRLSLSQVPTSANHIFLYFSSILWRSPHTCTESRYDIDGRFLEICATTPLSILASGTKNHTVPQLLCMFLVGF